MAPLARAALAALAAALVLPASALAADCPDQPLARTFLPWADLAEYTPAPDGGLEAGEWSLAGGAETVEGNSPYLAGEHSLSLPSGASATSPAMCIGLGHPTLRFFARNTGSPLGSLGVSVLVGSAEIPIGRVLAGRDWAPTPPLLMLVNLLGADSVSFRFEASGGEWSVDDVYVDPYRKG